MHKYSSCDTFVEEKGKLSLQALQAIECALDRGYLVELMKLRDGTIKARTVKKKEIQLPAAQ